MTVPVGEDGAFSTPLELSTGNWAVAITATSKDQRSTTQTRNVTIAFKGVNLVVAIKGSGSRAWLKVWVDGKVSPVTGDVGKVFNAGKVLTFTARDSDRGPDGRIERDVLHAERGLAGAPLGQEQPGDVAVPATGRPEEDQPSLSR